MPLFDATPREPTETRHDEEIPTCLARGIVWADVLADIAADEEAHRLRLRDAA